MGGTKCRRLACVGLLLGLMLTSNGVYGQIVDYSPTNGFNGVVQQIINGAAFSTAMTYGGTAYSELAIFRDGCIIFSDEGFPAQVSKLGFGGYAKMCPFYTSSPQTAGTVYYQLNDVSKCFSVLTDPDFVCENAHVVTWVGRNINYNSVAVSGLTYQAVIAYSAGVTYLQFNFETNGFAGVTEPVDSGTGFDFETANGDLDSYSFSAGKLGAIPILETMLSGYGNYQEVGRFVYLVSGVEPVEAAFVCVSTGIFDTNPSVGSVTGGTAVGAVGPCIPDSAVVTCRFGTSEVTPRSVVGNNITCISPRFGCTSTVDFNVLINGQGNYRTTFSIVAPEESKNGVLPSTSDQPYGFEWSTPVTATIALSIIAYSGESTSEDPLGVTKHEVALTPAGSGIDNTGEIHLMDTLVELTTADRTIGEMVLEMPDVFLLCVYDDAGEFSFSNPIYALAGGYKQKIYELVEPQLDFWRDYWEPRAKGFCQDFIDNFSDHPVQGAIPAPCSQEQAEYDIRFTRVPGTNCFESIVQTQGQQNACYDADGNIICGEGRGSEAIYNPNGYCYGGVVLAKWGFDHAVYDVTMKDYCCLNRRNNEQCGQYNELTMTDGCRLYNPYFRLGQATGFGQIFTMDGLVYTVSCEGSKIMYSYGEFKIYGNYRQINRIWATCSDCPSVFLSHLRIENGGTSFEMEISDVTNKIDMTYNTISLELSTDSYMSRVIEDFTMVVEHYDGQELGDDGQSWKIRFLYKTNISIEVQMYGSSPYMLGLVVQSLHETPLSPEDGLLAYDNDQGGNVAGALEDKVTTTSYFCIGQTTEKVFETETCAGNPCTYYDFGVIQNSGTNGAVAFVSTFPDYCDAYSNCLNEYYLLVYSNTFGTANPANRASYIRVNIEQYIDYRAKRDAWNGFNWRDSCGCPARALGSEVTLVNTYPGSTASFFCVQGFYTLTELEVSQCTATGWTTFTAPVCTFCRMECVNGECTVDADGNETCECEIDWGGTYCNESTVCNLVCQNDGTCIIDVAGGIQQHCQCSQGWTGELCEIELTCYLECVNGECITTNPANAEPFDECVCYEDWWTGTLCDTPVCTPPCGAYGECAVDGGPFCDCDDYWVGEVCDTVTCDPQCVNGQCVFDTAMSASRCSCQDHWGGPGCDQPICTPNCVEGNGVCEVNTDTGNHQCTCFEGWEGADCGTSIDCTANGVCENGACLVTDGSPHCQCYDGYTGEFCETSTCDHCDPDGSSGCLATTTECLCKCGWTGSSCSAQPVPCSFNGCQNGGTCSIINSLATCCCTARYSGSSCEIDLGMCENSHCNNKGDCTLNNAGEPQCECYEGFTGDLCETVVDMCPSDYCNYQGSCDVTATTGYYQCDCISGYTGERCEVSLTSCQTLMCLNGGTCDSESNRCTCFDGYIGERCETSALNCGLIRCENGGTCEIEDYKCQCPDGFSGNRCEIQISNCGTITCLNGGWCQYENYRCSCKPGYSGNSCETPITSCGSLTCLNAGVCGLENNRYKCFCQTGYYGLYCQHQITSCQDVNCKNGGVCEFFNNEYHCACQLGFYGAYCENFNSNCHTSPCRNSGSCFTTGDNIKCYCPPGVTGSICERDVNECASNQNPPCRNGRCVNLYASFRCECDAGYTGRFCDAPVEICSTNPCRNGGLCLPYFYNYYDAIPGIEEYATGDSPTWYTCTCPNNWTGKDCETDVDECKVPYQTPCLNGGGCMNVPGDYKCNCTYKYYGKICEYQFYQCNPSVCRNGGRCEETSYGYNCLCQPGYSGANCQIILDVCRDIECRNGGVCVNNDGLPKCVCGNGFGGSRCEEQVDGTQQLIMIALLVVLAVFIIFGVAILICCCWRNACRHADEDDCKEVEEEVTSVEPWTFASPMITHHVNSYGTYAYRPGNEIYVQKQC